MGIERVAYDNVRVRLEPARRPLTDLAERLIEAPTCLVLLVFLAPLLLVVAAVIRLCDRGPVLFGHTRVGLGGRRFKCLKFRTMVPDAEGRLQALLQNDPAAREEWLRDQKLRRDPRITPVGEFLRKSSLDDLPQLINILKGEMSLVGPRPIVTAEIQRYGRFYPYYCSVRPGLTGLWQVSGRNDVNYRRRVAMDVMYIRRRNLGLYLWVLFATIPAVLMRDGAR
jgi:exopolysaccharide production protein ExoY